MSDSKPHILIVEARFYEELADELARGAIAEIEARGASYERVAVPGVLETLALANRELGTTVVIITHNVGIAAMAHRVLNFLDGRIASVELNDSPIDPAEISW